MDPGLSTFMARQRMVPSFRLSSMPDTVEGSVSLRILFSRSRTSKIHDLYSSSDVDFGDNSDFWSDFPDLTKNRNRDWSSQKPSVPDPVQNE